MTIMKKQFVKSVSDQTRAKNPSGNERRIHWPQQDDAMTQSDRKDEVVVKINGPDTPKETQLTLPSPSPSPSNPKDCQYTPRDGARVLFNEANRSEPVQRRSNAGATAGAGGDEVLGCTSNSSFGRKLSLPRGKTKSRLVDPPEQDQRSQRMMKSGVLGRGSEIDEDDPFLDEDLPEEYKRMKYNRLSVIQLLSLILIMLLVVSMFGNTYPLSVDVAGK